MSLAIPSAVFGFNLLKRMPQMLA